MGDLPGLVRLSIALRIQPNDGPVFFKVDGQRFGQNRTIKLLTGSSYKVEVKIKPTTLQVENISIGGVVVPLELKSKEPDGDRIVYTGTYDTEGVAPTKSGERQPIQITMPECLEQSPQGISYGHKHILHCMPSQGTNVLCFFFSFSDYLLCNLREGFFSQAIRTIWGAC
ncbi:CB1 cannabinoid receptor-interacting protein 1 isoform X1 [Leptonychotes weddellii]|uniref:CB1 cannabinoid receptor-interacting protein 1 n=1 Tax=Leptonychotes weddellii TaxID=9713 RepID=A0A2U3XEZ9_LEPWE|nr:CB1 cannabinoid receptor-interacting protein 1 isoform X1 [Leptonychotes weddellii]